jgi:2-dehydro-3-deoxy-D-arabinonate dehydratase
MKIGQIEWKGRTTAAVFDKGQARPIPGYGLMEFVHRCALEDASLTELAAAHAANTREAAAPVLPIEPVEVWACGCTYEMSASFRDAEHGTREGFYRHVFTAPRPEIFFKGNARVCVGPGGEIGIREDSKFTAPEPELAVLLGEKGSILGYTLANDVSAWDIERENPLYLPQSKVYNACCALGPWFVTPDELTDPYALDMTCTIQRGEKVIFEGAVSTSKLGRKVETLIEYLMKANDVPAGSVLLTGTGIIAPQEAALAEGDVCTISATGIGRLSNRAVVVR